MERSFCRWVDQVGSQFVTEIGCWVSVQGQRPVYKAQSGYLLDATDPNRLCFSQLGKCNRFNMNGLLSQSVEQLAA